MSKKINQRTIGFVLSYASIFVSSLIGVFFTPYMILSVGSEEYGLYQILYATIGYVALLDFGLGSTLTRFLLKFSSQGNQDKIDSVISISIKIYCLISIFLMLVVVVLSLNLNVIFAGTINLDNLKQAQKIFVLMGLTAALSLISHALSGIQTAHEKYLVVKGIYILRQIARVVIAYVLLQFNIGALAIVITDLFITAVLLFFDIAYCKIVLKVVLFKGKWNSALAKSLFSFSFYVFLQIIIAQTNTSLDRMLLGVFATLEIVAIYGVVMQLSNMFASLSNVVSGVTFPQISRAVFSNPDRLSLTMCCTHYSRYQLLISAPLLGGFVLFGKMFTELWLPSYDSKAIWICTIIIVVPEILAVVEGPIFHVMKAKNLQKTRSLILFGVMIANVVLTVLLIQINPVYGPAIATGATYVAGNLILSNIYYHKKVGIDIFVYMKELLKGILPAWLISIVAGIMIILIPLTGWFGFVLKCGLYLVVYALCIYLIGINREEKAIFYNYLKKLKLKKI